MSPRAAWRLELLGFTDVRDYVGSKVEWMGMGLPWEGTDRGMTRLGDLAGDATPTFPHDATAGDVRKGLGGAPFGLVLTDSGIVVGKVTSHHLEDASDSAPVCDVMGE